MLPDPLALTTNQGLPTIPVGGVACTFRKIRTNTMVAIDGVHTADTPAYLSSRNRLGKAAPGSYQRPMDFSLRYERHFNAAPLNGVPQSDIPLVVELRCISTPSAHTVADVQVGINTLIAALNLYLARLQAGEGI